MAWAARHGCCAAHGGGESPKRGSQARRGRHAAWAVTIADAAMLSAQVQARGGRGLGRKAQAAVRRREGGVPEREGSSAVIVGEDGVAGAGRKGAPSGSSRVRGRSGRAAQPAIVGEDGAGGGGPATSSSAWTLESSQASTRDTKGRLVNSSGFIIKSNIIMNPMSYNKLT